MTEPESNSTKANRYGRKPGRGLRPWILVPKVAAVGTYFGAIICASVLWRKVLPLLRSDPAAATDDLRRITTLFTDVAVPSLVIAMLLGIALFMFHPGVYSHLRWLQAKWVSMFLGIPTLHIVMSTRLLRIKAAAARAETDHDAIMQFSIGLVVAFVWTVWMIVLGRVKPRLRQNWGRAYPRHGSKTADKQAQA